MVWCSHGIYKNRVADLDKKDVSMLQSESDSHAAYLAVYIGEGLDRVMAPVQSQSIAKTGEDRSTLLHKLTKARAPSTVNLIHDDEGNGKIH
jgi:hypothetical protein